MKSPVDDELEAAESGLAQGKQVAPGPCASRARIVIADDNLDALQTLALLMRKKGFEVTTAIDGADALSKLHAQRPEVALLDIGMPVMDGYDVAWRIRREPWAGKLLLVAVTGWSEDRDRLRAYAAGFDLHLTKPVNADVVEKLITERPAGATNDPVPARTE